MRGGLRSLGRTWRILFLTGFAVAPGIMTAAVTVAVVTAAASVTYTIGFRLIVDAAIARNTGSALVGAGVVAGLFSLQWGLAVYATLLNNSIGDLCNVHLSSRMAALINAIPGVEHFERPDYLQQLDLLEQKRLLIARGPEQSLFLIPNVVRSATIVILLAVIYPPLVLMPLLAVFAFVGDDRSARLREQTDRAVTELRRLRGDLFTLSATAGPASELRTFGLRDEIQRRHHEVAEHVRRRAVRSAFLGSLWSAGGWFVYGAGFAAAIVILVVRAVHGDASLGDVVLSVSLLRRAQQQVSQISGSISQLVTTGRATKHLMWLEDRAEEATSQSAPRASVPASIAQGITIADVTFVYPGTTTPVLQDVSVLLPAGAVVAIVGENGAGKSTLVKLLTSMYQPTKGSISVDGVDLASVQVDEWRARTTAAFQDFVRFQLQVGQTVGVGDLPRIDDEAAITAALDRAQAADVATSLPEGLRTPLGWSMPDGRDLSGGQWQKLALGRAMMRDDPLLMVLDEPTASLDAPTESALFERYVQAARRGSVSSGTITVLVSHRFSTVRMADLIIVVQRGRIEEAGSHEELVKADGLYAELFELQARAYR
jgi:ATP-binding cassette, subfamily B, bacterial